MKIVKYPHPALRHKSRALTMIDEPLRKHAARMLELMYEAKGLGLAANQVALPYRLLVMNSTADPLQREHEHVLINPQILDRKGQPSLCLRQPSPLSVGLVPPEEAGP